MRNKNLKNELTSNNCLKINRFKRYSRNNSLIEYDYNNFTQKSQANEYRKPPFCDSFTNFSF